MTYDKNWIIRAAQAQKLETPPEVLELLAEDHVTDVRFQVADNPRTPATALEKLANDKMVCIRYLVAKHVNTPVIALEKLADDKSPAIRFIRFRIMKNPRTPERIKNYLMAQDYMERMSRWIMI